MVNWSLSRGSRKSDSRGLKVVRKLVDMPISEKFEESVIGCHLNEKSEVVPIKKRRFFTQTSSPPSRTFYPNHTETAGFSEVPYVVTDCTGSTNGLGRIVNMERDVDENILVRANRQADEFQDFSGITLLATVACSNSFGVGECHADDNSGFEESSSLSKRVSKEYLSSVEVSTEGSGFCVSPVDTKDRTVYLTKHSPANVSSHGKDMAGNTIQNNSVAMSEDFLSNIDEVTVGTQDCSVPKDRLLWDLNVTMDKWDRPFDNHCPDSQTAVADGTFKDMKDRNYCDKIENSESHKVSMEPSDCQFEDEKDLPLNSSGVVTNKMQHLEKSNFVSSKVCDLRSGSFAGVSENSVNQSDEMDLFQSNQKNTSCKMSLKEPVGNNGNSYVSDENDASERLDVTYDSPYEDGEVRESPDNGGIKTEQVDYGSDNANNFCSRNSPETNSQKTVEIMVLKRKDPKHTFDAADSLVSRFVSVTDKATIDYKVDGIGDTSKKLSQSLDAKMRRSGWDQSPLKMSSDMISVADGSDRRNIDPDCRGRLEVEDAETKAIGVRKFRKDLKLHDGDRAFSDVFIKENKMCVPRNCHAEDLSPRSKRESGYIKCFARSRYTHHAHARGKEGKCRVYPSDRYRSSNHLHSPNYHGRESSCSRPCPENIEHRQLANRNEAFGLQTDIKPIRELSSGRSATLGRDRSIRYGPQCDARGLRGRYEQEVTDHSIDPNLSRPHASSKRKRSTSPVERKGYYHSKQSCAKFPSSSGIGSPNSGTSYTRRESKYLNFKSDVRMQRVRSPHHRPRFSVDHMAEYRSMPRAHGSPPRDTSRRVSNSKDGRFFHGENGYNQHSSVSRKRLSHRFRQFNDRLEFSDSCGGHGSRRPGRFSRIDGVGRRLRYDGSDDERENFDDRYAVVRPVKQYDVDGSVKLSQCNVEGIFLTSASSHHTDSADFHGRESPKDVEGADQPTPGCT